MIPKRKGTHFLLVLAFILILGTIFIYFRQLSWSKCSTNNNFDFYKFSRYCDCLRINWRRHLRVYKRIRFQLSCPWKHCENRPISLQFISWRLEIRWTFMSNIASIWWTSALESSRISLSSRKSRCDLYNFSLQIYLHW